MNSSRQGVLLYGHDTYGLGHIRRNLAIAETLKRRYPALPVAILSGSPVLHQLTPAPGVMLIPLPPVVKVGRERYASRVPGQTFEQVIRRRREIIARTLAALDPRLWLTDHAPLGVGNELAPILDTLAAQPSTLTLFGLRDVVDAPDAVVPAWERDGVYQTLARYREIWVYGERRIFDPVAAYRMGPELADRVRFMGYLGRREATRPRQTPPTPFVVVAAGGGEDGLPLFEAFREAWPRVDVPNLHAVLIPGPLFPAVHRPALAAWAAELPRVEVEWHSAGITGLLAHARLLVSMAGYNTVTETLSYGVPAILRPRTAPRREQSVRAAALARWAPVAVLEPGPAEGPRLARHIQDMISAPVRPAAVDLDGLDRVARRVGELLGLNPSAHRKEDMRWDALGLS